jgi:hypothetical protein
LDSHVGVPLPVPLPYTNTQKSASCVCFGCVCLGWIGCVRIRQVSKTILEPPPAVVFLNPHTKDRHMTNNVLRNEYTFCSTGLEHGIQDNDDNIRRMQEQKSVTSIHGAIMIKHTTHTHTYIRYIYHSQRHNRIIRVLLSLSSLFRII